MNFTSTQINSRLIHNPHRSSTTNFRSVTTINSLRHTGNILLSRRRNRTRHLRITRRIRSLTRSSQNRPRQQLIRRRTNQPSRRHTHRNRRLLLPTQRTTNHRITLLLRSKRRLRNILRIPIRPLITRRRHPRTRILLSHRTNRSLPPLKQLNGARPRPLMNQRQRRQLTPRNSHTTNSQLRTQRTPRRHNLTHTIHPRRNSSLTQLSLRISTIRRLSTPVTQTRPLGHRRFQPPSEQQSPPNSS